MNNHIKEMASIICSYSSNRGNCDWCGFENQCSKFVEAEALYNAGYRKASDVIDEINNAIPVKDFNSNEIKTGYLWAIADVRKLLLKLKKKYESEGAE